MRRFPWDILLALLLGLGAGLAYSWMISPLQVFDSEPIALRTDFKDDYRSAIAASYAVTGNLPRARARLALLGDSNLIETLNSQAQRLTAGGEFAKADQLAALALALDHGTSAEAQPTLTSTAKSNNPNQGKATATFPPTPEELPFQFTETPPASDTETVVTLSTPDNPTPRPTRTLIPTVGAPFTLTTQDSVCDANLPDGLLQVIVFNSSHRQVAGARIVITWDNGEEQFFTGLKPELGNGYADYNMSPGLTYTVRLAAGSDIASGLTAPTCQTPTGESFQGGIKLTFEQP
jgi:hypothetical protein